MSIRSRRGIALTISFLLAVAMGGDLYAHGEGVLKASTSSVQAGAALSISGSEFEKGERYRLVLRGALRDYDLASASADANGAFQLNLKIPAEARPGTYQLTAIAADGDQAASLDLVVEASTGVDAGRETEAAGAATSATPEARAEERPIERSWSGVEWFVIGAALSGALVGGLALYGRR